LSAEKYDVTTIGAGPADLFSPGSAPLREGLKTVILEKQMAGGRVLLSPLIETTRFRQPVTGIELWNLMVQQGPHGR